MDIGRGNETGEGGGIESNPFFFNPDVVVSDEQLRPSSSSSSYSSASGSSMDGRFQTNTKVSESRSGIASTSSSKLDDHVSDSLMHDPILTQSPPVQVMDRIGEYDPYRIPSSVFARSKSLTPADSSFNSNDSLFSIQVEDNRLSRDHALSLKSGEIPKSGELFTIDSPVPSSMDHDNMSVEIDKSEAIGEKATPPTRFCNSPTPSDYSDGTGTSVHSFAFPVLDGGKNVVPEEQKREQPKQYQQQQEQGHGQEEQPLTHAVSSKSSCCIGSCSWFDCFQWSCCSWHWNCNCNWHWCNSRCCRGKGS